MADSLPCQCFPLPPQTFLFPKLSVPAFSAPRPDVFPSGQWARVAIKRTYKILDFIIPGVEFFQSDDTISTLTVIDSKGL